MIIDQIQAKRLILYQYLIIFHKHCTTLVFLLIQLRHYLSAKQAHGQRLAYIVPNFHVRQQR